MHTQSNPEVIMAFGPECPHPLVQKRCALHWETQFVLPEPQGLSLLLLALGVRAMLKPCAEEAVAHIFASSPLPLPARHVLKTFLLPGTQ